MVKTFYITAAPVGAVPKFLDPLEPKFIPHALLELLPADAREATTQALEANGWRLCPQAASCANTATTRRSI